MAHTRSAQKSIRKDRERELRNREEKSRLKTLSKRVSDAAASGDGDKLNSEIRRFSSALDKAGKSGLVHRNKIARHKARCARMAASGTS